MRARLFAGVTSLLLVCACSTQLEDDSVPGSRTLFTAEAVARALAPQSSRLLANTMLPMEGLTARRPQLALAQANRRAAPGDRVFVDLAPVVHASATLRRALVQVVGARDLLEYQASQLVDGARLRLDLPGAVGLPDLCLDIVIEDSAGRISAPQRTCLILDDAPLLANAGPSLAVLGGESVNLRGSTLSEAGVATVSWEQLTGPVLSLDDAQTLSASFVAPQTGSRSLRFLLTVTDANGASSQNEVSVAVAERPSGNLPPQVVAGEDRVVVEGQRVNLFGDAGDRDGSIMAYSWQQSAGMPTVTLDALDRQDTGFTAPEIDSGEQILSFLLSVTDDQGAMQSDSIAITVRDADFSPPVANAGNDRRVVEGSRVELNGGNSSGEAPLAFSWQQLQESGNPTPNVSLRSRNTATPNFDAPLVNSDVELLFELTVTDAGLQSDQDQVRITITNERGNPEL